MESRHLAVMMTDIQGFTRATSGMGREQVEELLALHEDLLVPVIKEGGGTIVKGLGDAFLVTFESPTRGVQAGVRIQEVLAEHNAAAEEPKQLRVRVALNAGEVNIRDGDVFGEAVNITARVEGVCAAEQVTLTEAVFLLLEKESVETEYLEEVELKGIPFPVKLYRVTPAWLPPEDRDVERARSKPAPTGAAGAEGAGGAGRVALVAGGVAALVALGSWLAQPAPAHVQLARATEAGAVDEAWAALEQGLRERPTPELRAAAERFGQARLAAHREAGEWRQAFDLLERLATQVPGIEGLTRPKDRVALAKQGVAALRAEKNFAAAGELRNELLAIDRLEGDEDLVRWAREDLRRVWEERCPSGEPPPEDLETRIAATEVTAAVERLAKRDHRDPFLALVRTVRAAYSASAHDSAERWKDLSEGLASQPELGERQELRPALRIFCSSRPEPQHREQAWTWAEPMIQRKLGSWVEPALREWANAPAPASNHPDELVSHLRLRRNALRLAVRRGLDVAADAGAHALADARVLTAAPKAWGNDRTMAELQGLALRVSELTAGERATVEPVLRELLEKRLDAADASPTTRETYTRVARDLGFEDLVQPHRELHRDLEWALGQVGGYNFRPSDWLEQFTKGRLARVEPGIPAPWRASSRQLLADWAESVEKKFPAILPAFREAQQHLAEE